MIEQSEYQLSEIRIRDLHLVKSGVSTLIFHLNLNLPHTIIKFQLSEIRVDVY